jgi:hypothetical protein
VVKPLILTIGQGAYVDGRPRVGVPPQVHPYTGDNDLSPTSSSLLILSSVDGDGNLNLPDHEGQRARLRPSFLEGVLEGTNGLHEKNFDRKEVTHHRSSPETKQSSRGA